MSMMIVMIWKQGYDIDMVNKLQRENKYTSIQIYERIFVKDLLKCARNENAWAYNILNLMASKIKIGTVSETKNFKKIQRYFPYII
jgi:hypothetical protein